MRDKLLNINFIWKMYFPYGIGRYAAGCEYWQWKMNAKFWIGNYKAGGYSLWDQFWFWIGFTDEVVLCLIGKPTVFDERK